MEKFSRWRASALFRPPEALYDWTGADDWIITVSEAPFIPFSLSLGSRHRHSTVFATSGTNHRLNLPSPPVCSDTVDSRWLDS